MISRFFVWLIKQYQKGVSPRLGANCRFQPTCSQYAIEAFETRGAFVGFWLAFYRILRCNPLCKGGYDPVPQKRRKL